MWRFFDRCDAAAKEISTAIMDALFIKAGLLDEPTTEMGRQAYDNTRKDRRHASSRTHRAQNVIKSLTVCQTVKLFPLLFPVPKTPPSP